MADDLFDLFRFRRVLPAADSPAGAGFVSLPEDESLPVCSSVPGESLPPDGAEDESGSEVLGVDDEPRPLRPESALPPLSEVPAPDVGDAAEPLLWPSDELPVSAPVAPVSAQATPYPVSTAYPTPSATARPPTRPIDDAAFMMFPLR